MKSHGIMVAPALALLRRLFDGPCSPDEACELLDCTDRTLRRCVAKLRATGWDVQRTDHPARGALLSLPDVPEAERQRARIEALRAELAASARREARLREIVERLRGGVAA